MTVLTSSVFDLVDRIAAASTVCGVWDAYLGAAREVGLGYGVACFMPPNPDAEIQIISDALPDNWLQEYHSQGLAAGDLLMDRARASKTSFEWTMGDWDLSTLTPIQQRWRDHNLQRGIFGGLSILDFRRGEDMLMVICGPDGQLHSHDRLALYFTGQEAMLRLREMAGTVPNDHAPLSRRERECLQWAAVGKTDWEIGRILSLSEKTVNVYIERAKTKFGVSTRGQAVVLALRNGLIAA
jgi:LuxR family quorum sensing-dependent transcriptional regulator